MKPGFNIEVLRVSGLMANLQKNTIIQNRRRQCAARKGMQHFHQNNLTDCYWMINSYLNSLGASHTGSIPVAGTSHPNA
jgi:hypothetical protein